MKKSRFSKMAVLGMVLSLWAAPLTVSASSKVLTDPLVVTQAEQPEEGRGTEETKEHISGPLTPEGNLTLVDDYGSANGQGKQFITVETKNGAYFYIIIDRDDHGMETVHFLNKVEEEDLLALMEEEAIQDYLESKEPEGTVPEGEEPKEEPTEEPEKEEPEELAVVGLPPVTSLLLIAGVMGVGGMGGYFYLKKNKIKPTTPANGEEDPEEDVEADLEGMEFDDEDLDAEDEEE